MSTTSRNRLGKRLRALRESHGLSLNDVAKTHGVDKGMLSRIERGETRPSLSTLRKLRDAYAVDDAAFLAWIDAA